MKRVTRASLVAGMMALAAVALPAQAQEAGVEDEMRPYLSELYSYTFENDDRVGVEEGQGGQLSFGMAINKHWGWEIGGFYSEFPHDNSPGANAQREYGAKLDGLYFYSRNPAFAPYFSIGAGAVKTELRGTDLDSTDPLADAGVGFFKYFTLWGQDLAFRADLRYRYVFFDKNALGGSDVDGLGEGVLKIGLAIPFGSRKVAEAPAASAACIDSDGDGVCDPADLCPGTPPGTAVDAKGCPKAAAEGAARKFEDVYFEFDKSDLRDSEKSKLDSAATTIDGMSKTYPNLKVDVSGHTDWIGTDGYNQGLSERRANQVKSYLTRKGVDAGRINTFAFGESKPKASNETAEGRAQNRRAEIQTHE